MSDTPAVLVAADATIISRRLRTVDPKTLETRILHEVELADLADPIVFLGDPGLGKTMLTKALGQQGPNRYVRAGTFVRSKMPAGFKPQPGGRLIIDGLDEVASANIGGGVDAVLE